MKLPNIESVDIPTEKVRDYLLSPSHPVGRHKAVFFNALGYSQDLWKILSSDIQVLLSEDAQLVEETVYGSKYQIRGMLKGPNGQVRFVVTAWIIRVGENFPRFVTAYPGG